MYPILTNIKPPHYKKVGGFCEIRLLFIFFKMIVVVIPYQTIAVYPNQRATR